MLTALQTRAIASEAREFARQTGKPVGTRGRLSRDVLVSYFLTQPHVARQAAKAAAIPVSRRGRISPVDAAKVAEVVR